VRRMSWPRPRNQYRLTKLTAPITKKIIQWNGPWCMLPPGPSRPGRPWPGLVCPWAGRCCRRLAIAIPAVAGALSGYAAQRDYARHAERSRLFAGFLDRALDRLLAARDLDGIQQATLAISSVHARRGHRLVLCRPHPRNRTPGLIRPTR
jgi:hypothetical protein